MLIDGKALAGSVHSRIKNFVTERTNAGERQPGLAVILVGDNPASKTYVANKDRTATQKCGFKTFNTILPNDAAQAEVAEVIKQYNSNNEVDGILLQLPLPSHLDSSSLLELIDPRKDVDGLHPVNQGLLMAGRKGLRPCTPSGILKMVDVAFADGTKLDDAPVTDLSGRKAVVVGRSILVGKPIALMLLERNATVTMVHSRTAHPELITKDADIVVAAVGKPELIDKTWISKDAIVIDVGINRLSDGRLVGDVNFQDVKDNCRAITPVPGGVGPMTVAMLMANTLDAYISSGNR